MTNARAASATIGVGSRLGQFVILEQIGEGGMGQVFLAEHVVLKTKRVVKTLLAQYTRNAAIIDRFVNEARASAAIQQRNIITVDDCAQTPAGDWYIVMAFLKGATLAHYASLYGALPLDTIVQITAQIANGLAAAHAVGIVHRDLKPENIFITAQDNNPLFVTILDFGIAKLRTGNLEAGGNTQTGQIFGTPSYMAPEQMRAAKDTDLRADIYSLGVIVYQLATGGFLPFQDGDTPNNYANLSMPELFLRQSTMEPIDPRKRRILPSAWADSILAALRNDPVRRPQTVREFALMLAEATVGDATTGNGINLVKRYAPELLTQGSPLDSTIRGPLGLELNTQPHASRASQPPASQPPTMQYVFDHPLGMGGMAEVFRGRQVGSNGFTRNVAIKRVLPGFEKMPQFMQMFSEEARLASLLTHSNIISVYDFTQDGEGRPMIAMELVEGKDMDALRSSGPIPLPVIIYVIAEVLRGLGYAHNLPMPKGDIRGLVHRDVSPHNILLSWDGAVKVSDFGIAKARDATAATASIMIKGKPAYMSPEQANGEPLDGRSDLFAVGIMLWELLTWRPLFTGSTREMLSQVVIGKNILRPGSLQKMVPADLEQVTMKLLARDPRQRYATAEATIEALLACNAAPRNGRSELTRLLDQRFPPERRHGAGPAPIEPDARTASKLTVHEHPSVATRAKRNISLIIGSLLLVGGSLGVIAMRKNHRPKAGNIAPQEPSQPSTTLSPASRTPWNSTSAAVTLDANLASSPDAAPTQFDSAMIQFDAAPAPHIAEPAPPLIRPVKPPTHTPPKITNPLPSRPTTPHRIDPNDVGGD